jgi:hypothetical protein
MHSSAYSPIERLRYWEGQTLRSRDFEDQAALDAQMRWWHNRALHRAFGASTGLEVSPLNDAANQLVGLGVSEGIAHDCFGRELVLCPGRGIRLPEGASSDLFLMLRRKQARSLPSAQRPECALSLGGRTRHETELVWKCPGQCDVTDGIPLARVSFDDRRWQLDRAFHQPVAHALARPRVANGMTVPGKTVWEEFGSAGKISRGLQTSVDTTAAGFTQAPIYFAWLVAAPGRTRQTRSALGLLALPTDIVEPTSAGFTFRVLISRSIVAAADTDAVEEAGRSFTLLARKLAVRICWIGCQHTPEAPVCRDECECHCAGEESAAASTEKEDHHAH